MQPRSHRTRIGKQSGGDLRRRRSDRKPSIPVPLFEILLLFQKLHAEGRTIIFVTHNPELSQYSSRNIRLRDGQVIEDTTNPKILSAAEALAALPKNDED